MGKPITIEKKQAIERAYVIEGVTLQTKLSERFKVSRPIVRKIIIDQDLATKRAEQVAQPEEIGDRLKKILHLVIDEMDEMVKNKQVLALKPKVADLEKIVRSLARIDALFDSKGAMIKFCYSFVDFVATLPKERTLLTHLRRVLPLYIDHIEKQS